MDFRYMEKYDVMAFRGLPLPIWAHILPYGSTVNNRQGSPEERRGEKFIVYNILVVSITWPIYNPTSIPSYFPNLKHKILTILYH